MIHSIRFFEQEIQHNCSVPSDFGAKLEIDFTSFIRSNTLAFDIHIEFTVPITQFRNADYTWVDTNTRRIANEYSPKIIKLQNSALVQANCNYGIWEVDPINTKVLLWRFNAPDATPITQYHSANNQKTVVSARQNFDFVIKPSLLFPKNKALEWSRSKIPFSAIAVFTDHCDFDTPENLKLQRQFFKAQQIKITKGYFINHFSKRPDNASFERDMEELRMWQEDGHELCYHSLSQSIKSVEESFKDFTNFTPPFVSPTWIDHGYQPYNFTLYKNNAYSDKDYENVLKEKQIKILWNYIDTGTATGGVINQLNPTHFTLERFSKGNSALSKLTKAQLLLKNIIFHYYADEELIHKYKSTAGLFKKVVLRKEFSNTLPLIKNLSSVGKDIFKTFWNWNSAKKQPYKLAKYSPIVFKHRIDSETFYVFQTLEMVDFKSSLAPGNLDQLIQEKGVFIAHTYFSVPLEYHLGKLFKNENEIDPLVAKNFEYLRNKIINKQIWNPTLAELIQYWAHFEKMIFDIDSSGTVFCTPNSEIHYRTLTN
ncbi:hypothetical protein OX284_015365 [Flavobacterium sp. SUN046]|uniref:hypothetical protein n=1 Tax=Flavobacterium sp. SUN046 TaxID=3002440 RepID=UPI002DB6C37A|nr:hypothetical protein [Flavobacterium sp. SUN046]MEC4050815.1 hypothetical protein [Flavobacterium sp. SUN046]